MADRGDRAGGTLLWCEGGDSAHAQGGDVTQPIPRLPEPPQLDAEQAAALTRIVFLKRVPKGTGLSYGLTHTASRDTVVATLPVGYADGYSRLLSNKGEVLVRGRRCPIVGRVCMDQFMVDITHIPQSKVGDEAILLGYPGGIAPDGEEMALLLETISHEITCQITRRVPRVYTQKGKVVSVNNY